MSLESIRQAFTPDQQRVTALTAAVLPSIANLLASLGIDTLTFTQALVSVGATSVTLVGQVTWRASSGTASLVGSVQGTTDRLVFDLDITTPSSWTLGVAFPVSQLPAMWRNNQIGLSRVESFIPRVQVKLPSVHATNAPGLPAHLSGWLPLIGDLAPYASYVGPGDLGLGGDVTFASDGTPHLKLDAMSNSAPARPGGFDGTPTNGIGLRITTEMPDNFTDPPGQTMSALLLITKMVFSGQPIEIVCPLMWGDDVWPLYANLWSVKPRLADGLASLATMLGLPADSFALPSAIDFVNLFYLAELGMGLVPPSAGSSLPSVQYLRAVTGSDHEWAPPIPYVRIGGVGASWMFYFWGADGGPILRAQVWGEMRLGGSQKAVRQPLEVGPPRMMRDVPAGEPNAEPIVFKVSVYYPEWVVEGQLLTMDGGAEVPLQTIFSAFNFAGAPSTGLEVHDVSFRADPRNQTFDAQGAIAGDWKLPIGGIDFVLSELAMWVSASQSAVTGGIKAFFYLDPTGQSAVFSLSAEYLSSGRWRFTGQMEGTLSLIDLLVKAFKLTPPAWVADMNVSLTKLNVMLDTGAGSEGSSYSAEGAVVAKWHIDALGIDDLALAAEASIAKTPA